MNDPLKTTLHEILKRQSQVLEGQAQIFSHLEALRLTLYALDVRSEPIFQQALAATREKYEQEIRRIRAELELLQATVSTMVQ